MGKQMAKVTWTPEDIRSIRPDWTMQECREWLEENEDSIRDRMVEVGWDVIRSLIE